MKSLNKHGPAALPDGMRNKTENQAMLEAALNLYGLEDAAFSFIRHNENAIYDVRAGGQRFALRIHAPAPGFEPLPLCKGSIPVQRDAEAELVQMLGRGGFRVQTPVPGRNGRFVQILPDKTAATLFTWLPGGCYDVLWPDGNIPDGAAYGAGRLLGGADAFFLGKTSGFAGRRPRYGTESLPLVEQRLAAAGGEGVISPEQLSVMREALRAVASRIREAEQATGLTVCHADGSAGNFIWDGQNAALIDFSLAGIASPYLDLAFLLSNFTRENVRRALIAGFEDGYGKRARLRLAEPYYALGIMLFICQRYRAAADWEWFSSALERWCGESFRPLAAGEPFIERPVSSPAPFTPSSKTP